jgi:riboflavin kinase/FMN adenylyltransferase
MSNPTSSRRAVIAIGNFDGVHLGHQYMLKQLIQRGRLLGLRTCVVTFDPDPIEVLRPDLSPRYLTEVEEKVRLVRELGVDDVWVCSFDQQVASLGPEQFLDLVSERHPIAELWAGEEFALGHKRSGTVPVLEEIGARRGFSVHIVQKVKQGEQRISSTRIREALALGNTEVAARLLGRPYTLTVTGDWANGVLVGARRAMPAPGAYVGTVVGPRLEAQVVLGVPEVGETEVEVAWVGRQQPIAKRSKLAFGRRLGDRDEGSIPPVLVERARALSGR